MPTSPKFKKSTTVQNHLFFTSRPKKRKDIAPHRRQPILHSVKKSDALQAKADHRRPGKHRAHPVTANAAGNTNIT
jgi:hypothetical protein